MRVVHAVTHFDLLTGSGIYVYELARVQAGRGHQVTVLAENIGGELTARMRGCGVEVVDSSGSGDGRASVDLVHTHQPEIGQVALDLWPGAAAVATVHSPWPGDAPPDPGRVQQYVCVRPEIRAKVVAEDGIPRERIHVLLNGVDRTRFRPRQESRPRETKLVLCAATMSTFRRPAVLDLLDRSQAEGFDVLLVGIGDADYLDDLPPNARWERREVWAVEELVAECDEVAGTFLGRTAIEAWLCDKPAWVYDVDPYEGTFTVGIHPPPPAPVLDLFDIELMTDAVEQVYTAARCCHEGGHS